MARSYSTTQADTLHNYQIIAYYAGVNLGIFDVGDHTFGFTENYEYSKSSLTGSSNFKAHTTGTETTFSFVVREYNKNTIKTALANVAGVSGGTATNATTPFVGAIEGTINPKTVGENALVVYPIFYKDSTQYIDDTSNPLALLLPKAVCVDGFEFAFNSETPTTYELTFQGMPDVANGFRTWVQDDGIATDGSYAV